MQFGASLQSNTVTMPQKPKQYDKNLKGFSCYVKLQLHSL